MAIDINSISPTPPGKSQNNGTGNAVPAKSPADTSSGASQPAPGVEQDSVELSSAAQDLGRIQQALQDLPEVDEARVEAISQQIAEGRYQLDTDEIAARILADDQNFLL